MKKLLLQCPRACRKNTVVFAITPTQAQVEANTKATTEGGLHAEIGSLSTSTVKGVRDMEDEAIKLFFSYSHKDEILRNELVNHLRILTREGVIASWDDRRVLPGDEWNHQIHAQLQAADIVLLLISVDFIASDYCNDVEVRIALQRHAEGDVCVIPIILRAVDWTRAPFSKLQALPTNGKPVTSYVDRDEAFLDVAQGIRQVAETLRAQRKQKWEEKQNTLNQYKQKVEEILSSSRGRISVIARDTLQELCAALRLTPEEAHDIETHAFKPYHEYEDKLKRYEQTLRKVLAQQPLSEETKQDLQYRQRDLGIKPEDVARIEQLILAEGESLNQEEAQALQSQEAERARQQDLQAQRTREEMAQPRERAWEAQYAQEELRAAQDEAQHRQEAARPQQQERQQQRDTKVHTTLHDDSQPSHGSRLSSSKTRLWVGGSMITIVLAFVFFLYPTFHSTDTDSSEVSAPKAQNVKAGAPASPGPGISITTAELIAEGTTVSGSLVPGQERHFFQFTASRSKIRVIVHKRSKDGFQGAVDVYDHNKKSVTQAHESVALLGLGQDQPITLSFESYPGELYYIAVTALGSNARGDYELTVREER